TRCARLSARRGDGSCPDTETIVASAAGSVVLKSPPELRFSENALARWRPAPSEGVVPDVLVRFLGQTNMGHGLRVQALLTQFAHQCRRNVFVQQYTSQRRLPCALSIRNRLFGRPGAAPNREASRAYCRSFASRAGKS